MQVYSGLGILAWSVGAIGLLTVLMFVLAWLEQTLPGESTEADQPVSLAERSFAPLAELRSHDAAA